MNTGLPDYKKPQHISKEIPPIKFYLQKLTHQIQGIGEWLGGVFSISPKFKISQHQDDAGNELWEVYDARTERRVYLTSEEEVRVWIEESFYCRHQESNSISTFDLYRQRRFI